MYENYLRMLENNSVSRVITPCEISGSQDAKHVFWDVRSKRLLNVPTSPEDSDIHRPLGLIAQLSKHAVIMY